MKVRAKHKRLLKHPLPSAPKRARRPGCGPVRRRRVLGDGGPYDGKKFWLTHEAGRGESAVFRVGAAVGRYVVESFNTHRATWRPAL